MATDLAGVRVVVRRACDVCEGAGDVLADEWAAFYDRPAHGPDDVEAYFLDELDMVSVPPMKRECGVCEDGTVVDDMLAEDLIAEVLARVPTSVLPRVELEGLAEKVRLSITAAATRSQGLGDPDEMGSWLRAVQEGAEALRSLQELLTDPRED